MQRFETQNGGGDHASDRAVLAKHGRSFWLASLFLGAQQRDDAAQLYRFCRAVDDLADETPDPRVARVQLGRVRAELRGAQPARPWVKSLLGLARRASLDLDVVVHLVDGVSGDLDAVALRDDAELSRYCYAVAGTVGVLMCGVLGVRAPRAVPFAVDLGLAMQLTNICRDVLADAELDRRYVPASRVGDLGPAELMGEGATLARVTAVRDLLAHAERLYASAELGMRYIPWRARFAMRVAARVYRQIGRRLLRVHGGDPGHGRTVVPAWEKCLVVLGAVASHIWALIPRAHPVHDGNLHRHLGGLPGTDAAPLAAAS